ncbi:hypothetical protein FRB96_001379 [Tulasnella sp. 330]|nr:hypothetical protein FRB96_001379 [Tulasnella sp. 330]KAG8888982.1 hypothetical protein FRB98_006246 [Tulasnella sp. 332]
MLQNEAEHVLYTSITISDGSLLQKLHDALAIGDRGSIRRKAVRHLLLDPAGFTEDLDWSDLERTECVDRILHLLDDLTELGLYTRPGPEPYRFRLKSLAIDNQFIPLFLSVHADSQLSIHTLRVRTSFISGLSLHDPVEPISSTVLPNLQTFGGTMNAARRLTPGHPVSFLFLATYSISTSLDVNALKDFISLMSVPIITLTITAANLSHQLLLDISTVSPQLPRLGLSAIDQVNLDHPEHWAPALSNLRNLTALGFRLGRWARRKGTSVAHVKAIAPAFARTCYQHCPTLEHIMKCGGGSLPPEGIGAFTYQLRHSIRDMFRLSLCSRATQNEAEHALHTSIVISNSDRTPKLLHWPTANNRGTTVIVEAILQLLDSLVDLGMFLSPGPATGPYPFQLQSLGIDDMAPIHLILELMN